MCKILIITAAVVVVMTLRNDSCSSSGVSNYFRSDNSWKTLFSKIGSSNGGDGNNRSTVKRYYD